MTLVNSDLDTVVILKLFELFIWLHCRKYSQFTLFFENIPVLPKLNIKLDLPQTFRRYFGSRIQMNFILKSGYEMSVVVFGSHLLF